MTLGELKYNYARERGIDGWLEYLNHCIDHQLNAVLNNTINEICILAQKEALNNADNLIGMTPYYRNLITDKILSENNLIK